MKMTESEFLKDYFEKHPRIQGDLDQLEDARDEYQEYLENIKE